MKIKIDKRLPVPPRSTIPNGLPSHKRIYPFSEMKKGDSFSITLEDKKKVKVKSAQLLSNAQSYCRYNGLKWKFTVRTISETTIRIWRIK